MQDRSNDVTNAKRGKTGVEKQQQKKIYKLQTEKKKVGVQTVIDEGKMQEKQ